MPTTTQIPQDLLKSLLTDEGSIQPVSVANIRPNPYQHRTPTENATEELRALADNIAEVGLLSPPIGRRTPDGTIELATGHRRLEAVKLLGWETIQIDIRTLSDEDLATIAFSENYFRTDVSSADRARLIQLLNTRFGWTHAVIAQRLGLSRPTITNILGIFSLPEPVRDAFLEGKISERSAMALSPLRELPQELQDELLSQTGYSTPGWYLDQATKGWGSFSSDDVRRDIAWHIGKLTRIPPDHWHNREHPVEPPIKSSRCTDCPARVNHNGQLTCVDLECFGAKSSAYLATMHKAVVANWGLPLLPENYSHGSVTWLSVTAPDAIEAWQTFAADRGCNNLHVRLSSTHDGTTKEEMVCYHPKSNTCGCKRSMMLRDSKASRQLWKIRKAEALAALQAWLEGLDDTTLELAGLLLIYWSHRDDDQPERERLIKAILDRIQSNVLGGTYEPEVAKKCHPYIRRYEAWFRRFGIPIPWEDATDETNLDAGEDDEDDTDQEEDET